MEKIKKILVLTDFSPTAWNALSYAAFLCEEHRAGMTLLHVRPSKKNKSEETTKGLADIESKLNAFGTEWANKVSEIRSVVLEGNVSGEVHDFLAKSAFDLIVMGLNGNGGMNNEIGKNARSILQESNIPVLVLPR